jgi:hypothetical protein
MLDIAEARDRRALAQSLGVQEPSYVTAMLGPLRGSAVVQEPVVSAEKPAEPPQRMRR